MVRIRKLGIVDRAARRLRPHGSSGSDDAGPHIGCEHLIAGCGRRADATMRIDLDTNVACVDGAAGKLTDVVVDPRARRLTHLVVQLGDPDNDALLVPIGAVSAGHQTTGIALGCTVAEIRQAERIQESGYVRLGELPAVGADWDIGIQEMFPLPEAGSLGSEMLGAGMAIEYDQHVVMSYHRVPKGCVELRRASAATTMDGHHAGHVVGFMIDDAHRIIDVVVEHGHLWGKHTVAIPSLDIDRFETDELVLSATSDEVGELKPLPDDR